MAELAAFAESLIDLRNGALHDARAFARGRSMIIRSTKSIISALTVSLIASALTFTVACAPPAAAKDDVIFLKQGWSDEDRMQYYFTSQGTAVMPYGLFINLEEAASSDLIRSDRIAESLGMIPQAPDPKYNPDGLPVGITRAVVPDGRWKGEWVGINCALCHTDELHYKGKSGPHRRRRRHAFRFHENDRGARRCAGGERRQS